MDKTQESNSTPEVAQDNYTLIIEQLKKLSERIDRQDATIKDVTDFNRSLLSTPNTPSISTPESEAKAKLEKYLQEH